MARSGRFGRQPRSYPSLTNTLVSISREFQQQRAENIMSAWQKGGTFEGQKATDELVLQFWRGRMEGVSKDDPYHDMYQNAVTQLDYNIHESKMTADYAQGKKSDAQMIAFYKGWSGKVPKNSEFYRVLMRDAGQYIRSAKAKNEAAARAAAEARYQSEQNATRKGQEAAGEYAIETLRRVAQSGNAAFGIGGLISAPGSSSDLTDFDPRDPATMMQLMSLITGQTLGGRNGRVGTGTSSGIGSSDVLFHDDDGKAITGKAIIAQFQKLDPGFKVGTPFNVDYVTNLLDREQQGLNERIARALKTGHMTDVTSLTKSKEYVALLNREVKAYPVQKAYQEARADYDAVTNDPTASPQSVYNAWQKYSSTLIGLSKDKTIEANDAMRSQLVAEAEAKPGTPTLNETFTGLAGGDFTGKADDIAINASNIERISQQIEAVKASALLPATDPDKVVWTYGKNDSNGNFVPQAGGPVLGAATTDRVNAGGTNGQTVIVDDPRGGGPMSVQVTAVPIFAVARDPRTGEAIDSTGDSPIGYAYNIPKGGQTITTYGFQTKDGFVFSDNPPWQDGLKMKGVTKDGSGRFEVDFTPVVTKALGDKDPFTGLYSNPTGLDQPTAKADGSGLIIRAGAKPGDATRLAFDPAQLSHSSDERDWTGGPDPATDFHSLTLATLLRDTDGMNILRNLDKNPVFAAQLANDTNAYAGVQVDPKTGAWVLGTGDPSRLQRAGDQTNAASTTQTYAAFVDTATSAWQRLQTGSAYVDTQPISPTAQGSGYGILPSDALKTDKTPFQSLGNSFVAGTNNKVVPNINAQTGFTIKPVAVIKAPTVAVSSSTQTSYGPQGGATAPQPIPSAAQTGISAPSGWTSRPDYNNGHGR